MKIRGNISNLLFIYCYFSLVHIFSFAFDDIDKEYGKVIHVSAIFRHGNRNPYAFYPLDPYKTYPWIDGVRQLTQKGKQKLYNLGKWFQQRYKDLHRICNSHVDIKVHSSDIDRTIMSAQCFLAGFYPPKKENCLDTQLLWQPVPIHTIPKEYDNLLYYSKECKMYKHYAAKFYSRSNMKKKFDKHKKTIDYIQKHTGYNFSREDILTASFGLYNVYDALLIENENNLKLPSWTKKVFPQPLKRIVELLDSCDLSLFKVKRLRAGPLLKLITTDMTEKVENNATQKFHFYSGHDYTITVILKSLRIYNNIIPPYAALILFELRQKMKENFVTIFYKNSTNSHPHLLQIPKCKTPCNLKNFLQVSRRLIPLNWDSECQLNDVTTEVAESRINFS